jgi:hypothetical protein
MMWPLSLPAVAVVAVVTLAASSWSAVRAHRMRVLTQGAVLSGDRAAMVATERRVRRAWRQHCTYALPTVAVGMALLTTQAVATLAMVLPR